MNFSGWLQDPVTLKELSGLARRWQTYVARGIYVGLFAAVVWSFSGDLQARRSWVSNSALADLGRRMFQSFMMLQFGMVILSAISAASDLVTKEVRLGTLGVLICSPLTPMRVALGKWKAALAQTTTLIFCGLPILGLCTALGGATPRDLAVVTCLSLAASGLGAAMALYGSSIFRSGTTALIAATGAYALYVSLPEIVGIPFGGRDTGNYLLSHLHLAYALEAAFVPGGGVQVNPDAWMLACLITVGLSLVLVARTAARIRTLSVRTPAPPLLNRMFEALDRFYEELGPDRIRKLRFFSGSPAVWEDRAILWKELRTRASGRLRNSVRIALSLLIVLAVCFHLELQELWIPAWAITLIVWFMALANGASLFVKEKEERKWDILLATPLSSFEIIMAKLQAGAVPLLPMLVNVLFFWTIQAGTTILHAGELPLALFAVALPAALAYLLGAVCSLQARSLRAAFSVALSGMIGLTLLVPWLCSEFDKTSRTRPSYISPVSLINAIVDERRTFSYSWRGLEFDQCFAFVLVYAILGGGLMLYLLLRFDEITGRSE